MLDYDASECDGPNGHIDKNIIKQLNWIKSEFINKPEDNDVIKYLKALKHDAAIAYQIPTERILCKRMGLPMLNFANYLMDPLLSTFNKMAS